MRRRRTWRGIAAGLLALAVVPGGGASTAASRAVVPTYYVDSRTGDDADDGRSPATAWRTLETIAGRRFVPGSRILLRSGSIWRGGLRLTSSGRAGAPITVAPYGSGAMPRIDAGGVAADAVALVNVSHVRVAGLEITNSGGGGLRRGVLVAADNIGTLHDVWVERLYIHDVAGTNARKENGGIVFRTSGDRVPSRFVGLRIERNIVWKVDRSGIVGVSDQLSRRRWFPSHGVVIRDNYLEDVGGDGITPWATDGGLIEHNIVRHAVQRAPEANAGLWQWSTDNTLIQLNDVARTRGTLDGQGYDSDYNSRGTTFLYNYSHDNDGGFLLICTPVARDPQENIGNTGTVARWNISRHDGTRTFHFAGADDTLIERNAIYTAPRSDIQLVLASDWDGWSRGIRLRDNLFAAGGIARYGHQVARDRATGLYRLASGWAPAREVSFAGNRYLGRHVPPPVDTAGDLAPKPLSIGAAGWSPPRFDPARPRGFSRFLAAHRTWQMGLMTAQFGHAPRLAVPTPLAPVGAGPGRAGLPDAM